MARRLNLIRRVMLMKVFRQVAGAWSCLPTKSGRVVRDEALQQGADKTLADLGQEATV